MLSKTKASASQAGRFLRYAEEKGILAIPHYQAGKSIDSLMTERGISGRRVIKMASNENPLGPSPRAVAAIRAQLGRLHEYPSSSSGELRKKLAKRWKVKQSQILIGNGSNEILEFVIKVFLGPGTQAIVSDPSFLMYGIFTLGGGGSLVKVPLKDYHQDLDAIGKAINKRTRIIFLCNPHNPTGTYISRGQLETFLKRVPRDVIVVLDEAYREFATARDLPPSIELVRRFDNCIVIRTFSKALGLAGLRVGWGCCCEEIVGLFDRVRQPFNVNRLGQVAACAALDDKKHLAASVDLVRQAKRFFYKSLDHQGISYVSTEANFLLMKVGCGRVVYDCLLDEGIIVRPIDAYGLPEYIRVTFDRPKNNRRFLRELKKAL